MPVIAANYGFCTLCKVECYQGTLSFCKPLKPATTAKNIFNLVKSFFNIDDIPLWCSSYARKLVQICYLHEKENCRSGS